jgi:hypothetical protein
MAADIPVTLRQSKMEGYLISYEIEMIWKKNYILSIKVPFCQFRVATEENQNGWFPYRDSKDSILKSLHVT